MGEPEMNLTAAVALALASVAAYAGAAAMQHRVASSGSARGGLRALLTSGGWWVSTGLNATGAGLHVAALKYGTLTLVQCLGALTVVAAVPLGARIAGRRVSRAEWRGVGLTLAGFGALLPLTATGSASGAALGTPAVLAVALTAALFIPLALSARPGSPRTLAVAAASGIASGTGSALTQTVLHTDQLLTWTTALVVLPTVGLAVAGLLLSQSAYTGGLGAPLATLTLANPLTATAIGLTLLGEQIHGGLPGAALALTGAALAARGILLLARPATPAPAPAVEAPVRLRPAPPQETRIPGTAAIAAAA
ncbi:DMT family transporter [Streptomyces capparidis]